PGGTGAVLLQRRAGAAGERADQRAVRAEPGTSGTALQRALRRAGDYRSSLLREPADVAGDVAERVAQAAEELLVLGGGDALPERRLKHGVQLGVGQRGEPVIEGVPQMWVVRVRHLSFLLSFLCVVPLSRIPQWVWPVAARRRTPVSPSAVMS